MPQSLSRVWVHAVWHIRYTSPEIRPSDRQTLFRYMGGVLKEFDCIPICINGVGNHVHLLFALSRNYTIAKIIEKVKTSSSRWLKTLGSYYNFFAWQGGYGIFSVSESVRDRVIRYIQNQEKHHKSKSFENEYVQLLDKHHVEYDKNYLFCD